MSRTPPAPRARRRESRTPARRIRRALRTLALHGAILTRPPRAVHRTMVQGANSNGSPRQPTRHLPWREPGRAAARPARLRRAPQGAEPSERSSRPAP